MSDTNQVSKIPERAKPNLVQMGKTQVIATGKWNNELVADYMQEHGYQKWRTTGDLAKYVYHQNVSSSKARVRKSIPGLRSALWSRGALLVVEYAGPHGMATALKIADLTSEHDRQLLHVSTERARRRKELSAERYEKIMSLIRAAEEVESSERLL